jgi:carbamoyl-phosphate synthase large subunit
VVNELEIERLLPELDPATCPCVQPYLGSAEDEYTVGVLTDFKGQLIDSIVMRRKLTGLSLREERRLGRQTLSISTGYSQGFIVRDNTIQAFCEGVARDLDSRGPLNIQLRVVNGAPQVFEVHPRFSGTTPIRASVGLNEPDVLLRSALYGESFGRQPYTANVAAIRAFEHVIVPMEDLADFQP